MPFALVGGATGMIGDPKDSGERRAQLARRGEELGGQGARADRAVPVVRGPATPRRWSTTTTGPRACRRSTSCATSASTSRSTGCWPATWCRSRLEDGISYTEFSYVLLQSMDYLNLHRDYGVTLQFGGSDQWGNITGGVELIRRADGERVHALATPLITRRGRHEVRQDRGRRPVARPGDAVAVRLLPVLAQRRGREGRRAAARLHVPRPRARSRSSRQQTAEKPFLRAGQKALAEQMTTLVHGAEETARIKAASAALFGGGALHELDVATLAAALREAGAVEVSRGDASCRPSSTCSSTTGLSKSKGEARRTVGEGGAYLNNERVHRPGARARPRPTCSAAPGWCCGGARRTSPGWRSRMSAGALRSTGSRSAPPRCSPRPCSGTSARAPATARPRLKRWRPGTGTASCPRCSATSPRSTCVRRSWAPSSPRRSPSPPPRCSAPSTPEGEVAMARGIAAAGSLMVVSSNAGSTVRGHRCHRGHVGGPRSTSPPTGPRACRSCTAPLRPGRRRWC